MRMAPPGGLAGFYTLLSQLGVSSLLKVPQKRKEAGHFRDFATFLPPGSTAPDFALKNLDGQMVSLSDFRGQYVVLEFGAYT